MKSEIKKIILTKNNTGLIGFVVITNNGIKHYGYGELSNDEVLSEYSKIIIELKDQQKDKITGLGDQKAINKLYREGFLEYSEKDFIKSITCYKNAAGDIDKFDVKYNNSQTTISLNDCFDEEDFLSKLTENMISMCNFYGITIKKEEDLTNELLEKLVNYGLLKNETEEDLKEENSLDDDYDEDIEFDKSSIGCKIKNLIVKHKLISLLAGGTILCLITTIPGCTKKNDSKEKNGDYGVTISPVEAVETKSPEFESAYNQETTVEEIPILDEDYFHNSPTVEPAEYRKEIYFDGEDKIFSDYSEPSSEDVLICELDGTEFTNTTLDIMYAIRKNNMEAIANNIQGDYELDKYPRYLYFENMLKKCELKDRAFVKYFSMIGNEIIKNAYVYGDYKGIQDYAELSGLEVLKLIRDDVPLKVYLYGYEDEIRYSELSKKAKEVVLNIAWTNTFALNSNRNAYKSNRQVELWEEDTIKEVVYNGVWYTKADIGDAIIEANNKLNKVR